MATDDGVSVIVNERWRRRPNCRVVLPQPGRLHDAPDAERHSPAPVTQTVREKALAGMQFTAAMRPRTPGDPRYRRASLAAHVPQNDAAISRPR
jgi:hypothetical protein